MFKLPSFIARAPKALGRLALGLIFIGSAFHATAANSVQGTSTVSSAVANTCVVQSLDSIDFGAYDPTSGMAGIGSGQFQLTCTKGAVVTALPASGGKTLSGPSGTLNYALYVDSAMSKIWGGPSYSYVTLDFSSRAYINMFMEQGVSFSACQGLANGTAFWFQANTQANGTGTCGVNLGTTTAATCLPGTIQCWSNSIQGTGAAAFLLASDGTLTTIVPYNGLNGEPAFYLPQATSTQVSGITYTTPSTVSGANGQAITGTSTSVKQPLKLSYYAKVPGSQDVSSGVYQDTVVVSFTF